MELFRSTPDAFDLVITNMTMPNTSGGKLGDWGRSSDYKLIYLGSFGIEVLCRVNQGWMHQEPYTISSPEGLIAKRYSEMIKTEIIFWKDSAIFWSRAKRPALPVDAKICHCPACQKLHGAPMQWAAISATIIVFVMALTRWVIYAKKIYDLK